MKYEWIDEFLLEKKGVSKDFQEACNWIRYKIDGEMFAAICLEDQTQKPYYISVC